jgi:hypothetical protein
MKKFIFMLVVLAMVLAASVPALAGNSYDKYSYNDNDHNYDNRDYNYSNYDYDGGDVEQSSGDLNQNSNVYSTGDNSNTCTGAVQFGNTGNFYNNQSLYQYASDTDDVDFSGGDVEFAPKNETDCNQSVEQAAAASSW